MANLDQIADYLADKQWGEKTRISASQMSRAGCNGTINGYIDYKIDKARKSVWLTGRVYISSFSRTGANPGVILPNIGISMTSDAAVGYRGESPVELVMFNAESGRLSTLESFSNASGTRLTLMVPPSVFYYE